jgi:hypothetical protein
VAVVLGSESAVFGLSAGCDGTFFQNFPAFGNYDEKNPGIFKKVLCKMEKMGYNNG